MQETNGQADCEEPSEGRVPAGQPDAILFLCSAQNLSRRSFTRLEAGCAAATYLPHRMIRLEEAGSPLFDALDGLRDAGHRRIRVQPVGMPFPESLTAWLPGVLAHWADAPGNREMRLGLGPEPTRAGAGLARLLSRTLGLYAQPIEGIKPRLGKPGWDNPPDFDFHLLVCTGPRCHLRDAASLAQILKEECAAAGIADRCLTTRTGCIFPCNRGPVVAVYPMGQWFHLPDRAAVRRLVHEVLLGGGTLRDFHFHTARLAQGMVG